MLDLIKIKKVYVMNSEDPDFYYTRIIFSWLCFIAAIVCIGVGIYSIAALQQALYYLFALSIVLFILAFKISPEPDSFIRQVLGEIVGNIIFEALIRLILWPFKLLFRLLDGI